MSEFEERLNSLLNDPGQMERIASMAKSLMGGEDAPQTESIPELDIGLVKKISALMDSGGKSGKDTKLLEAMRPYLSDKRRSKMDRALKIARLASIAELAAKEFGGDEDV